MQRRHAAIALLAIVLPASGRSAPAPLRLQADVQGVRTTLTLLFDGQRASGHVEEQGIRLTLDGRIDGQRLDLLLRDPATGLAVLRLTGTLSGDRLDATLTPAVPGTAGTRVVFSRGEPAATAVQAGTGTGAGAGAIDTQLVGRWAHQSMINSGGGAGGFASFTTERTLELAADGQIRQWVRSVGGGGQWSADGGRQLEFSGRWQARAGELWVQPPGEARFQFATRYRLSGPYLVTEGPGARRIWQR